MNPIDIEKPTLKPGEHLCTGCWKVTDDPKGWLYLSYKNLDSQHLCKECQLKHGKELNELQRHGL